VDYYIIFILQVFFVLNLILGLASLCTWFERKASALIQDRVGANRAGAFYRGDNFLLKSASPFIRFLGKLGVINTLICDSVKGIMKEDFIPKGVSPILHAAGPFLAALPVFVSFAVIPFAPDFTVPQFTILDYEFGPYDIRMQLAPLDAGVLFILAMGSIAVYGVAIAGFTGNNKFSFLGGLRAAAQMVSYELAMGVALATAILVYGTTDLYAIVEAQKTVWGVIMMPIGFVILFITGLAETKRGPFDLPESESELVAGYFTEYSGMKFLLFWLGEFAEIALFSAVVAILFFGGWNLPFLTLPEGTIFGALLGHAILMGKIVFFCLLQIVIRWTIPRFRYDQLMNLGWKYLLPLSLVNLMGTAVVVLL
jgi:NADH-quinone oxidoreductase subunit H